MPIANQYKILRYLKRPFDAASNFRRWDDPSKCSAVGAISVAFASAYYALGTWVLSLDSPDPYLSHSFLEFGMAVLRWMIAFWALLFLISFYLRGKVQKCRPLIHATVQLYTVGNGILAYALGPMTNPVVGIVFVGATIFALIVFEAGPVIWGAVSGTFMMVGSTIAERMGLLPYAPFFAIDPFVGGRPNDWWVAVWGGGSLVVAFLLLGICVYIISMWQEQEAQLEELSYTDPLTRLMNRRKFMEIMDAECERARRTMRPVSLLMCDADHFKQVNDTYGHQVGDEVLKGIARVLQRSIRVATDTPARLGGEEFALLLAETRLEDARRVAERITSQTRELTFHGDSKVFGITISIGVTSMSGDEIDADTMLEAADALLYRAKQSGRNRVESATLQELAAKG